MDNIDISGGTFQAENLAIGSHATAEKRVYALAADKEVEKIIGESARSPMEKRSEVIDVCLVCALPEEVRALLEIFQPYCERAVEERISPRHHYPYRFATIKN